MKNTDQVAAAASAPGEDCARALKTVRAWGARRR
jgi:hypothetical protein